jgi:NADH-quinone oxidoreductase subunit K
MVSIGSFVMLGVLLFCIGTIGLISRRNVFVIYMSIELMLNAANIIFVAFARYHNSMDSQVVAMIVIAIAAAEAAVFLSVIIMMYRRKKTLDTDMFTMLRQKKGFYES